LLVNSYIETYGITATVIRPFNNFGPRQNSASYAGIIPIVIGNLREDKPIEIHGSGMQTRDFVFAPQTADLTVKAAKTPGTKGKTFNIATGRETSILDIVSMIKSAYGKPSHPIVFTEPRIGDVLRHVADTTLMRDLLGEVPDAINEASLAETIEWYLR
jgi:UDP-glucose 4-epimerase